MPLTVFWQKDGTLIHFRRTGTTFSPKNGKNLGGALDDFDQVKAYSLREFDLGEKIID